MTKDILITGGGGFCGKNLIKYLLKNKQDLNIHVFDNFISSNKIEFLNFLEKYDRENRVILYIFDICNIKDMTHVKLNFNFNEIYHFASIASPILYKKYPLETMNVGFIGTKNILEIARHHKCKVLFSSTSEIYGDAEISPQQEDYYGNVNSFGERSCYDESKRIAESLCYTYIKKYSVDIKIARIFNTYGEHMLLYDGRIITECIKHLKNDTTLKIFGDGTQTRSMCYIYDTIDMLVKLMESDCNIPVNIGNDIEINVNSIVKIVHDTFNDLLVSNNKKELKIEYVPLTQDDPLKRKPCLKRNNEIIGKRKYTSLENGIKNIIKYYHIPELNN